MWIFWLPDAILLTPHFIEDFFSKCDQIRRKLGIWSHLLKKSLMENFIFCAMSSVFHLLEIQKINLPIFIRKACTTGFMEWEMTFRPLSMVIRKKGAGQRLFGVHMKIKRKVKNPFLHGNYMFKSNSNLAKKSESCVLLTFLLTFSR